MKKITPIITALTILISGCNIYSNDTVSTKEKLPIVKTDFKLASETPPTPETLHFDSKAITQTLTETFSIPNGKHLKLELSSENNNGNFKIKIPNNSSFKLIFKKSNTFYISDNDATDGSATVNMPDSIMEGYIRLQDQSQTNSSDKLAIEDKLYFVKHDLNTLSPSNKEKWYKLGSKPFPIPNDWHSSDGNDYILNFNNSGIKNAEFRWFTSNKTDYPMNITMVTPESGGTIDFKGVGKIDIPAGAVDKNTIISMTQELNVPEILHPDYEEVTGRWKDFVSPIIKLEPLGLKLKKDGKIWLETDLKRVGNNDPLLIFWFTSLNKLNWGLLDFYDEDVYKRKKHNTHAPLDKLKYYTKVFPSRISPTKGIIINNNDEDEENMNNTSFNLKSVSPIEECQKNYKIYASKFKVINTAESEYESDIKRRLGISLCHFKQLYKDEPYTWSFFGNKIPVEITYELSSTGRTEPYDMNEEEAYGQELKTNKAYISLKGNGLSGVEHEVWHAFQFKKNGHFMCNKNKWVTESSAHHMGTRLIKLYSSQDNLLTPDISTYKEDLTGCLDDLSTRNNSNKSLFIPKLSSNYKDKEYYRRVCFFTYLASQNGDSILTSLFNSIPNSLHLDKFHDFAIKSYEKEIFDIYLPNASVHKTTKSLSTSNTISNPIIIENDSEPLPHLAMSYFKIETTADEDGENIPSGQLVIDMPKKIGDTIMYNKNLKVTALQYSGKNIISKKDINWGLNIINGLNNSFFETVLVISNSDNSLEGSSAKYNIKVSYLCEQNKSCTSNPCPYTTTSYNTKGCI